jgi:IS5 family transposase
MFKILVIQAINNLSDERAEFLINDRLSFMRFLGLGLEDRVPDARTIWLFREKLTTAGAIKRLFEQFDAMLRRARYIAMSGQIVDASLVAAIPWGPKKIDRARTGAEVLSKLCGISMGMAQSARHQLMENGGSGHAKEEDHEQRG